MRKWIPSIVLTATLVVCGCIQERVTQPSPVSESGVATGELKGGNTPMFHTICWPPPNFASSVMGVDTQSGLGTLVSTLGLSALPQAPGAFITPYGLAFDDDGDLWSINNWFDGDPTHSFSQLVKIDRESGRVTPIGPLHPMNFAGPEFDACGNLYATGFNVGPPQTGGVPTIVFGDSYLYRFDKKTGEKTRVGDTGKTNWMDLDFDPAGTLWATTENALYTIDTETGASTFVTEIHGVPQSDIPGVCEQDWPWMEVMGIAFDRNGVLWATAMTGFSPCTEGASPVMRIDVDTGIATVVGSTVLDGYSHGGDIWVKSRRNDCDRRGRKDESD